MTRQAKIFLDFQSGQHTGTWMSAFAGDVGSYVVEVETAQPIPAGYRLFVTYRLGETRIATQEITQNAMVIPTSVLASKGVYQAAFAIADTQNKLTAAAELTIHVLDERVGLEVTPEEPDSSLLSQFIEELEKAKDDVQAAIDDAAGNVRDEAAQAAQAAASAVLDGKVDKEAGKGLSTNDYTTAEKTKLAGLERATTEEAKAGTNTVKLMTPATTKAAIAANFYSLTADAEDIPSSTSMGSITTPGFYTGSGNTSGPEGGQFLLIVETHGTYARQTIDYSGEQYVRWGMADGSYWLSWEKLTNDGALYVAAAGINSGWDYRRWSDGKVEFWSSAYITGGAAQIEHDMAYPFTLTGAPIVWTQGVDNCWDLARPIYVEPSVNKNIKIYLYPRSTDSRTYRVNVYAVGNMA